MISRRKFVVANWKMKPETLEEAKEIFNGIRATVKSLKNTDVCLCPPALYLQTLFKLKHPKNMLMGAQNVFEEVKGSFTGEISVAMVKSLGSQFVLVGHSERRAMGETNEIIKKKMQTVFEAGLTPVLCIGEKDRDKEGLHLEFIKNQIKESLSGLPKKYLVGAIVAYEPIWAIGRSYREAMSATDIHETVLFIKKVMAELFGRDIADGSKVLYGGSVEAENASEIVRLGNVDGFLVGHASLVPADFSAILKAVDVRK